MRVYKVLLVDDEAWILEGLKAMIDWEGEGFCICATASNGLEAESLVREQQPDFILADIRMPGCDGLALLGRLRQAGCNALYAIISGYAEFSYAQECIKLGACGYLLKPVEEEELLSLLRCVRQTLGQRYEKRIMEELEQETGLVETLFPRQCYLAVVYGGERFTPAIPALCARLSRRSRLYLSEQPLFSGEADVPEGACVGAARYCPGNGAFTAAVAACREASWQGFVQPQKRFFQPRDLPSAPLAPSMPASPQALLRQCKANLPQVTVRHLYVLYLAIQGLLEGIQPDSPEWLLEHFENAQQLLETLENECVSEEETADEAGSVVAYLKEHFREDLSLDAVARALYMSNSSVRRVLMRECNDTFQHYLVMLRMEQARVLLKQSENSINEVAYACGFHDALYFRRVFKKWFGVTPSEYRAKE